MNSSSSGNISSTGNGNVSGGSASTNSGTVSGGAGGAGGVATGGSVGTVSPRLSSKISGGDQYSATSTQNGQNIGTGNTTVNANTNSSFRAVYIPPVIPPTPASQLAIGSIVKETLACGPLMKKISKKVEGTYFGLVSNAQFEQGHDDSIEPVLDSRGRETYDDVPLDADPRGEGFHRYGSQVVIFTGIVGLAGARNIAIGAGASSGSWGQAGMGGSGAIQQMVTTVQIIPCDLGVFVTKPADGDISLLSRIHG